MQETQESTPIQAALADLSQNHSTNGPDWAAITHDVFCPLCEYNLRGLIEPRCPECGYRFDWPEVLDPNRMPHPYLFEHHPERNLWSYRRTVLGACKPGQFWTSLHPTQPSRPWRLLIYPLIGVWLLFLLGLCFACMPTLRRIQQQAVPLTSLPRIVEQDFASGRIQRELGGHVAPLIIFFPIGWTVMSAGSLMILQISLRRGRLRNTHLIRCAVYAADPGAWAIVLLFLWICQAMMVFLDMGAKWVDQPLGIMQILVLCATWTAWRLRQACRYYLRFTWPTATAVLTQIIVLLAALLVSLLWDVRLTIELLRACGLWSYGAPWW